MTGGRRAGATTGATTDEETGAGADAEFVAATRRPAMGGVDNKWPQALWGRGIIVIRSAAWAALRGTWGAAVMTSWGVCKTPGTVDRRRVEAGLPGARVQGAWDCGADGLWRPDFLGRVYKAPGTEELMAF